MENIKHKLVLPSGYYSPAFRANVHPIRGLDVPWGLWDYLMYGKERLFYYGTRRPQLLVTVPTAMLILRDLNSLAIVQKGQSEGLNSVAGDEKHLRNGQPRTPGGQDSVEPLPGEVYLKERGLGAASQGMFKFGWKTAK